MGLTRRNKVSAEFSMSSLTDIIFLLLIFFMLTATFIQVRNLDLPEADSKTVAPTSVAVSIDRDGIYYVNGVETGTAILETEIQKAVAKLKEQEGTTVSIAAEKGVTFDKVSRVMGIVSKLKVRAIIATQPKQG